MQTWLQLKSIPPPEESPMMPLSTALSLASRASDTDKPLLFSGGMGSNLCYLFPAVFAVGFRNAFFILRLQVYGIQSAKIIISIPRKDNLSSVLNIVKNLFIAAFLLFCKPVWRIKKMRLSANYPEGRNRNYLLSLPWFQIQPPTFLKYVQINSLFQTGGQV